MCDTEGCSRFSRCFRCINQGIENMARYIAKTITREPNKYLSENDGNSVKTINYTFLKNIV